MLFKFRNNSNEDYVFTHAETKGQAAMALHEKLGVYVDPNRVYEVKELHEYDVFLINGDCNAYGYRKIIAYSLKQAKFFMNQAYGYGCWDFSTTKFTIAKPGSKLGDVIDADWNSNTNGMTINNINVQLKK